MIQGVELMLRPVFCEVLHPVLGRKDFFARFRVTFDQRASRMVLEPYADTVSSPASLRVGSPD